MASFRLCMSSSKLYFQKQKLQINIYIKIDKSNRIGTGDLHDR
jgi:hypothetical protein